MRGLIIFLGLLLLLAGGALAGAQYAPIDLSVLDQVHGAKDFVKSQMALYAGGGAAGFGLVLMIIGMATGGKKKEKPAPVRKAAAEPAPRREPEPAPRREPAPQPARAPEPMKARAPEPVREQPRPEPPRTVAPQPKPAMAQAPAPAAAPPSMPPKPQAKPQASSQPPNGADAAPTWTADPRLFNRQRVRDLVSINDAIKAYHAKNGAYPLAKEAGGFLERGKNWIPGLSPDYIRDLPRDPAMSSDKNGPQYVYVSDGANYKLLARQISLVGGTNVEVLGVKFDPSRQNTAENAAFGFWTAAFEKA
ncbi:MAG TPA: hypothetical protein VG942_06400 [Hyphomonadaceae bacterium]|nr:hypothetical protein [Hyphomonadaceae bacterium]